MTLSSRIAIFDKGRLQQLATPAEIYDRPVNLFVANFVGDRETNVIAGEPVATDGRLAMRTAFGLFDLARPAASLRGPVRLGVRPEAVRLAPGGAAPAEVVLTELAGADFYVTLRAADGEELVARADPRDGVPALGQGLTAQLDPARIHLFDAETGTAVSHGAGAGVPSPEP
jgi:multiple sugar transport system ATP-binding protein